MKVYGVFHCEICKKDFIELQKPELMEGDDITQYAIDNADELSDFYLDYYDLHCKKFHDNKHVRFGIRDYIETDKTDEKEILQDIVSKYKQRNYIPSEAHKYDFDQHEYNAMKIAINDNTMSIVKAKSVLGNIIKEDKPLEFASTMKSI